MQYNILRELKSFLADVQTEVAADGVSKTRFIGPIVISLKTELAGSQEDRYAGALDQGGGD